jgi:hypothetical protein
VVTRLRYVPLRDDTSYRSAVQRLSALTTLLFTAPTVVGLFVWEGGGAPELDHPLGVPIALAVLSVGSALVAVWVSRLLATWYVRASAG